MSRKYVTRDKNCYCHTCDKDFHHLGIMKHRMAHKERFEDLNNEEFQKVFETFNRHIAKFGVSLEFPSAEKRSEFFEAMALKENLDYPINDMGEVTF